MAEKTFQNFEKNGVTAEDIISEEKEIIERHKETEREKLNEFPIEVFPTLFQNLIVDCNKALNYPIDYTASSVISSISTAIGKSAILKVKTGWNEYAAFYIALIGNAGANKSHPMETALKPHEAIDRVEINRFKELHLQYEEFAALSSKEKKEQVKPELPTLKKTMLHNFTPEILHQRLTENDRGCTIVSEELATFLEGMNNYSKGDQISIYLSFWSNKGTSIDRVGKPVPMWLPEPFLNIIGGLQPRVLTKLFPSGKTDNGFLQRFLFAYPEYSKKQPINDFELNETLFDKYDEWIKNYRSRNEIIVDTKTGQTCPKLYFWSLEAKEFFYKWQKNNTESVNENNDTLKGEILNKFDIHFVRLSLILQIMNDYQTNQISLKAVIGAEKLCAYFQTTAMKVLKILENSGSGKPLAQNKVTLFKALPKTFATSVANEIGGTLGFDKKSVQRFLADSDRFIKLAHGQYSKKQ
jgi:hypothetical protein